ncbi:MAG: ABC transporter permease subunit, partial [Bacillota bacterium]
IIPNTDIHVLTILIGLIISAIIIINTIMKRRRQRKFDFDVLPIWITVITNGFIILAINLLTYTLALHRGLPNVSIILFIIIIIYIFVSKKTRIGRQIYAVGGNKNAAALSGVNTRKVLFLTFVNMGVLSAVSGIIYAARLNASTPKAGELFELDAIGSVFIGGASMAGGIGTVGGAIVGALVMGVINNGMSLLGLGIDWQQVVKGLVLLMAVWFDIATKNKR